MTGGAFTPQVNQFLEHTTNPWLEKPFAVSAVRAMIDHIVGENITRS
jgi:hypothetical protein